MYWCLKGTSLYWKWFQYKIFNSQQILLRLRSHGIETENISVTLISGLYSPQQFVKLNLITFMNMYTKFNSISFVAHHHLTLLYEHQRYNTRNHNNLNPLIQNVNWWMKNGFWVLSVDLLLLWLMCYKLYSF